MSAIDTIKIDLAKYGQPVLAALEMIQAMTGLGGDRAATALKTIEATLRTLTDGAARDATPAEILADLGTLQSSVVQHDLDADAELAARFPSTVGG